MRGRFQPLSPSLTQLGPLTNTLVSPRPPLSGTTYTPAQLTWNKFLQFRPFNLLSMVDFQARFLQGMDPNDCGFDIVGAFWNGDLTRTFSASGLHLVAGGTNKANIYRATSGPKAPYWTVKLSVANLTNAGTHNYFQVGLIDAASAKNAYIRYDSVGHTLAVVVNESVIGSATTSLDLGATFDIYFVLANNSISCWVNTPTLGLKFIQSQFVKATQDLANQTFINTLFSMFYINGDVSTSGLTCDITDFQCGYFGCTGITGGVLVKHKDGRPYIKDGAAYVAVGNEGYGSDNNLVSGVPASHEAIWKVPLDGKLPTEVAKLFYVRGGRVVGDYSGPLVWDDDLSVFHHIVPGWGTSDVNDNIRMFYGKLSERCLEGVHIIDTFQQINTPTSFASYDPDLLWVNGTGNPYLAYVSTSAENISFAWSFYSTLATGPDILNPSLIFQKTAGGNCEGSRFIRVGGVNYAIFAKQSDNSIVSFLLDGTASTGFSIPATGSQNGPPHATIFSAVNAEGQSEYFCQTFDGSTYNGQVWSGGKFYLFKATQTVTGSEFV